MQNNAPGKKVFRQREDSTFLNAPIQGEGVALSPPPSHHQTTGILRPGGVNLVNHS